MMFKTLFSLMITGLFVFNMNGQQEISRYQIAMDDLYARNSVKEFDTRNRLVVDRVYFRGTWLDGQVVFENKRKTKGKYPLRYDILNSELLVQIEGLTYVVPLEDARGFYLDEVFAQDTFRHHFVISKYQKSKKASRKRLIFEIEVQGEYSLLVRHKSEVSKPNRVEAIDIGSVDEKITNKEFYYLRDKKGRILRIPKRRKAAKDFFNKYRESRDYLDKNMVNFKDRRALSQLIKHMNEAS